MDDTPDRDPIVEEFRLVRKAFSERFGHDLRRMGEFLRKLDEECGRPRIIGTPRPAGTLLRRGQIDTRDMPEDDPIVAEIRRIREEFSRRFDHDIRRMGEYLRQQQEQSGREYFKGAPRPARTDVQAKRDADAA